MALSTDDIKARFPLPVYNFKVEINGEVIGFSAVYGLTKSFKTITYMESKTDQHGAGPVIMHMPGKPMPVKLTMKKGYIRTKSIPVLYNWINSTRINQVEKKDIKIRLTDEEGNAIATWTVINAFPVKLIAPNFNAKFNKIAIEQMELMADTFVMEEN